MRQTSATRSCSTATVGGIAIRRTIYPAPEHLDPEELGKRQRVDALVLLPDTLSPVDGQMVAGFRQGAQALRMRAKQTDVPLEVFVPEGSRPGHYAEHTADWVFPLVGVPAAAAGQLIANEIQRWIDEWRAQGRTRTPTLRYREVFIDETARTTAVRELEGPADEVADLISRRAEDDHDVADDEWRWPARE